MQNTLFPSNQYFFAYQPAVPDNKVHVAHMGPTWVLSGPGGPDVGPMNLAIKGVNQ